jgi:hypothetical protein
VERTVVPGQRFVHKKLDKTEQPLELQLGVGKPGIASLVEVDKQAVVLSLGAVDIPVLE